MRAIPMMLAVLMLAGCPNPRPGPPPGPAAVDPDGVACGTQDARDRVFVEIRYAADGRPSAHPDECAVDPHTQVTWRGPVGDDEAFAIVFAEGSPAGRGEPRELTAGAGEERRSVSIVVGDQAGRYKYGIRARGQVVDPAIIIRRTQ